MSNTNKVFSETTQQKDYDRKNLNQGEAQEKFDASKIRKANFALGYGGNDYETTNKANEQTMNNQKEK